MTLTDIIVLIIVFLILSLALYFGAIKEIIYNKKHHKKGCINCPMAMDKKIRRSLNDYKKNKNK